MSESNCSEVWSFNQEFQEKRGLGSYIHHGEELFLKWPVLTFAGDNIKTTGPLWVVGSSRERAGTDSVYTPVPNLPFRVRCPFLRL